MYHDDVQRLLLCRSRRCQYLVRVPFHPLHQVLKLQNHKQNSQKSCSRSSHPETFCSDCVPDVQVLKTVLYFHLECTQKWHRWSRELVSIPQLPSRPLHTPFSQISPTPLVACNTELALSWITGTITDRGHHMAEANQDTDHSKNALT